MANNPTSTHPFAGQLFYVPTHQPFNRHAPWYGVQWGLPAGLAAPQQPHPAQQAQLAHHLAAQQHPQMVQQQMQMQLTQTQHMQPAQIEHQQVLLKDHTNAKILTIKEKSISHYIDGQLILETSRPLGKKRKKKHNQSRQQKTIEENSEINEVVESVESSKSEENYVARLRAEMPKWSVADVVRFIEGHEDIKQYASKFADDEVDGKALLLMIDRNLNLQMLASMFKHGPAMKIEAALSKYVYTAATRD